MLSNIQTDKDFAQKLIKYSRALAKKSNRRISLMEVCGTHTTAISKSGLRGLLSEFVELRSGPGCPVCVTNQIDIDRMIALSNIPEIVVATFGDMMRVPGTNSSLEIEHAKGASVKVFYSPMEAVDFAKSHPDKEIVFLGVGFETTTPVIASSISHAGTLGIRNYSVFSAHKIVPPVMRALINDPELHVDGFILPGHVATIIGRKVFDFISSEYHIPAVIAGFEPSDVMEAVYILLKQVSENKAETTNNYTRLVHEDGNLKAKQIMDTFFEPADVSWRGFGVVPNSGLRIKGVFSNYDASKKFKINIPQSVPPKGCSCGDVLKGRIKPDECVLFGSACNPSYPIGPCMVSSEGACAAYYNYGSN
jgi:hydrogenase expression/formation protein HypD